MGINLVLNHFDLNSFLLTYNIYSVRADYGFGLMMTVSLDSKKQTEQRQRELLEGISPLLLELVEEKGEQLLFDKGGCQLVLAVLLECIGK